MLAYFNLLLEKDSFFQNQLNHKWSPLILTSCGALAATTATYICYQKFQNFSRRKHLLKMISLKQVEREEIIKKVRQNLQNDKKSEVERREIVQLGFADLRSRLQNDQLTASEVLQAFQWKALQAQEQTNCVCEFLLEANLWAKNLDQQYNHKKEKPPLFGIPVSVKEINRLIGHDATIGFAQYLGDKAKEDSILVTILKELGAIPFATTNIPQSLLSIGSSNPIYGVTLNPRDATRSSGGSSSGEGALIALHGSPLGLGTDAGGSVRIPAHWCGICALKPSAARLAQGGRRGAAPGLSSVKGTAGPMGPDVDSLVWFMRTVCDSPMFSLDPYVVPYPFNEKLYKSLSPMTIGYYDYDGWLQASSACRRAVDVAKILLESKGHKLVKVTLPFNPDDMRQLLASYASAIVPDGGQYLKSVYEADIGDPYHSDLINLLIQPNWFRRLRAKFARSKRSATIIGAFASSTAEQRAIYANIDVFKSKFVNFWRHQKLDALICPVSASLALPPELPPKLFVILWAYCVLYNLLDFPAGVVPCTYATVTDEEEDLKGGKNKEDKDDWISKLIRQHSKGTAGLPVGVQCVSLPYREEVCLRLMKEIETAVKEEEEKVK